MIHRDEMRIYKHLSGILKTLLHIQEASQLEFPHPCLCSMEVHNEKNRGMAAKETAEGNRLDWITSKVTLELTSMIGRSLHPRISQNVHSENQLSCVRRKLCHGHRLLAYLPWESLSAT